MWTVKNRPRYKRDHLRYPSDLTDEEWALVAPLIPPGKPGGGIFVPLARRWIGERTHRPAQSLPVRGHGLEEPQPQRPCPPQARFHPPHASKTLQSRLNSSDRLSAYEPTTSRPSPRHLFYTMNAQ